MTIVEWGFLLLALAVVVAAGFLVRRKSGGHAAPGESGHARDAALERRDFLKLVGAGAVGAGAGWLYGASKQRPARILLAQSVMPEDFSPGLATWYSTVCDQCAAGCGIMVRTREGRAKKIEGNPAHPVSQGKVCARGQAGLNALYNPDRIRGPMIRTGAKGTAGFEAASWGDALDRAAAGLGEGGVVILGGAVRGHLDSLYGEFSSRTGATYLRYEFDDHAALRDANKRAFDIDQLPHYDIANTDLLVSFGADFLGTWLSPVLNGVAYGHMRQGRAGRRGRVIQVEPRMSLSGANADTWLPAKAGSEGVLAYAMARHLVHAGRYTGPDAGAWRDALDPYTVAFAAERTGLAAAQVEQLAVEFGSTGNTLAIGDHVAVNILNHLAGRVGRPGGVILNPAPALGDPVGERADRDRMLGLIEDARAGRIRTLIVCETNPAFHLPGFSEALEQIPLVVVLGQFVDETAAFADVVLPTHAHLERWGDDAPDPGVGFPVASLSQPVVKPLYDTRPPGDIVLALAQRASSALPWRTGEEHLRHTWREIHTRHGSGSFEAFWREALAVGAWGLDGSRASQSVPRVDPGLVGEPDLTAEPADSGDEFVLHAYMSPVFYDGRGANLPWLQELPDPNTAVVYGTVLELNPRTAEGLGLRDGDMVEVTSGQGALAAPVITYPAIRPDTVGIAIGQGHGHYGRYAAGRGVNPLDIITPGSPTRVSLRATGQRARVIRNSGVPRELGRNILGRGGQ